MPFHTSANPILRSGSIGGSLVFAAGLSLLTTLFFGLLPALDVCREGFENDLREVGARQGTGARSKRAQSVVVISEVALSLVLLIGSTLLIRTFISLSRVEPGFDSHHVVLMTMPLHGGHTDTAASVTSMVRDARQELAAVPGVETPRLHSARLMRAEWACPSPLYRATLPSLVTANGWQCRLDTSTF